MRKMGLLVCAGWGLMGCGEPSGTGLQSGDLEALQARIEALESENLALSQQLEQHTSALSQGNEWSGVVGARLDALEQKTASLSHEEVNGHPALLISGVNVHLRNGEGETHAVNGRGNLIIGYQEEELAPENIAGSHNLVVGPGHSYFEEAFGGVVFGLNNRIRGPHATVTGGSENIARAKASSISGGTLNIASGFFSSVSGGSRNTAFGLSSSVSGGRSNTATEEDSSISGGMGGLASGIASSISGGMDGTASDIAASLSGGRDNVVDAVAASIQGGRNNRLRDGSYASSISGGVGHDILGMDYWIAGN